ncbi:uncharacterized protein LOC134231848 [Saccostrea cucullata]|uniref:uncharacterized protein LOC134231848 n=1 Tax=Saccostrea cuccullata TaxID=36930 RepID=UPI002ED057F1
MATGVKLKKFDGSDNVHIWLANFENWQKFHNESDAQALLAISCNFEGQAATWYHTLSSAEKSNMQLLKKSLKDRFAPNEATFNLMGIKQEFNETTDMYLARAEKVALGHDLPELYKVQFTVNGLLNSIKSRIIGKQPKTFQALREAIIIAKAELDCVDTGSVSELTLKAFASELKESLKQELCSFSTVHNQNSAPYNNQNKRQNKNKRPQQQWQQPPQQQWQQPPPQQWQQPPPQQWQQPPPQPWQQPPPQPWQQPQQQQWQQPRKTQWQQPHQQTPDASQRGRSCSGCGKSCYPRYTCPAYNHFCSKCNTWSHFEDVCRGTRLRPNFTQTQHPTNQSQNNSFQ